MKRLLSVITSALLLACTVLPFCSSADGMILWQDDFSAQHETDWIWEGTAFLIDKGKLEGFAEAVVHQSEYREDHSGTKKFKECAMKVTAHGLEDGGQENDTHKLGLWFADYISADGSEDQTTGNIVYKLLYNFEKKQVELEAEFSQDGEQFTPAGFTAGTPVATYQVPDAQAPALDSDDSQAFTIGMRVKGGVITGYLNDQKVIEFNAYRGAVSFTQRPSPLLLINIKCHCTFDDVIVATADYDLFNEGTIPTPAPNPEPGPNPNPGPAVTDTPTQIVTHVADVTDDSGNVVTDESGNKLTQVVSDVVTVAPADTNTGAHGVGGAATGDTAVVVVTVMVIALGSALAVKKFSRES